MPATSDNRETHSGSSMGDAVVAPPAFADILCATQGLRPEREAVRQAAILAGATGTVTYFSVWHEEGRGLVAQATVNRRHAEEAVEEARRTAAEEGGLHVETRVVEARDALATVLDEARSHDLLVVGPPPATRGEGITFGRVGTYAAHRSVVPVLIARPPAGDFPGPILWATDGTAVSRAAAVAAARIAATHRSRVVPLHVAHGAWLRREPRRVVSLEPALGAVDCAPLVVEEGPPVDTIVSVAARERCGLIVLGSRGLTGVRALGSVSERVAHRAACSVLVVR